MKNGVLTNQGIMFATKPTLASGATVNIDSSKLTGNFKELLAAKDRLIKHDNFTKRLDFLQIIKVCK